MPSKKSNTKTTAVETNDPFLTFLNNLAVLVNETIASLDGNDVVVDEAPKGKSRAKKSEPVEDKPPFDTEDAEEDEPGSDRRSELEGKTLKALRKMAIELGFDKSDVNEADKETLIESIIEDEEGEGEDESPESPESAESAESPEEDDDEDEEEDEDEDDELDPEELAKMTLTNLRKLAKEYDYTTADLKGLDKDGIIDLLTGEDDEDDEEDEDEDYEPYTKDDLNELSLAELKDIAKEWELKVRAGTKKSGYIKAILEAQDED